MSSPVDVELAARPRERGPTGALARLVTRRPKAVLIGWLAISAVCGVLATGLFEKLSNRGFAVPGSDSARAAAVFQRDIPGHAGAIVYAVVRISTDFGDWPERAPRVVSAALARQPNVGDVRYEAASVANAHTGVVIVAIPLHVGAAEAERLVPALRTALQRASSASIRIQLTGTAAVAERYGAIARHDLGVAEELSFPLTLVVLLIAFQAAVAALLPLVLAGATLVVAFAFLAVMGAHAALSVFVCNTASVLALGLGIDFSLFLLTRFRQELGKTGSREAALVRTMTTTGRTILLSAVTIATSLVGLLLVGVGVFTSMAIAATVVTLLAALTALTLLPALIAVIGPRIEWLRLDRVSRAAARARLWNGLGRLVTHRPVAALLASLATLVVLALPARSIQLDMKTVEALPRGEPVRSAATTAGNPTLVVTREALENAGTIIDRDPDVSQIWDATRGSAGWSSMQVIFKSSPDGTASRKAIRRLRRALHAPGRLSYVGGPTAGIMDLTDRIGQRARYAIAVAVLLGFAVLVAGLRSLLIPLKAVVTTLLSAGATLGILLRLSDGSRLEFFVPLVLFAILFGLSVDYELFLLSRIRDAAFEGHAHRVAVRRGLVQTGRSITLAGLTLVTVFVAFATSSLTPFRQLGTGLAIAVVLDVTLVRCVLVPATVVLLGRWNWWFPGMRDRLPVR
jgi:trehalose monomycolate/heme transporter